MGSLRIRRLGYALGAEVTGVDLREEIDAEKMAEIRGAVLDHVVICLPGQDLDARALKAFSGRFGTLDDNRRIPQRRHPDDQTVVLLANKPVTIDGKTTGAAGVAGIANMWHSDLNFTARPSTLTFLVAKVLPDIGGNTMFASMYAAYAGLSAAFKTLVATLRGVHDPTLTGTYLRADPEVQAQIKRANPEIVHPIVRVHPETGREALFIGERLRRFVGMTAEESRPIFQFLNRHATRYEYTYRHVWKLNDLVVWDNRASMHYAVPDFDRSQLRQMLRCSLVGPRIGEVYESERHYPG